jgi:hypothetical protein
VNSRGLDTKVRRLLPEYMTMGQNGMGGMSDMGMRVPLNSIPMVGGVGPYDEITMGGMFTILKVREELASYDVDPGWYENPPGTQALLASAESMERNGVANDGSDAPRAPESAQRSWEQAKRLKAGDAPADHQGHGDQ